MTDTAVTLEERALLTQNSDRCTYQPNVRDENSVQQTLISALLEDNDRLTIENEFLRIDQMTGLTKRDLLPGILEKRKESDYYSIIFFDIDHFKPLNDQFSHEFGDIVLEYVGKYVLKTFSRDHDKIRYGGEEFVVILPHTDLKNSYNLAERLRLDVQNNLVKDLIYDKRVSLEHKNKLAEKYQNGITISLGVVYGTKHEDIYDLKRLSDQYLYHSKRNGRNMTTCQDNYKP